MKKLIIAIDGHSGCGKSSTAKEAARRLGYKYIDSGATYRAAALYFIRHNISLSDAEGIAKALKNVHLEIRYSDERARYETWLNNENVEDEIREMHVTEMVSEASAIEAVRSAMIQAQRQMAKDDGIVMDGRDIGTVVFPDADLKIFMTADLNIRARRRVKELSEKNRNVSFESVKANLAKRDRLDSERKISPLKKANDAVEIDTSYLTFGEQVEKVVSLAKEKIHGSVKE